jgi:hypothetical protein
MTEEKVKALFLLADIKVLKLWKLENKYWPSAYVDMIMANPWWLVKTPLGLIEIGNRKRVVNIDWSDTSIRKVITEDDVTKDNTMVHAWTDEKIIEYLKALNKAAREATNASADQN